MDGQITAFINAPTLGWDYNKGICIVLLGPDLQWQYSWIR